MSRIMDAREEFYYQQSSQPPNALPPTFEQLPGTGKIVEGSDAHFECRIRGSPVPAVSWTRKGVPVLSDQRRRVVFDGASGLCTLTIRNLTAEDDGEYKCTARNAAGEASLTINIQRNDPNVRRQGLVQQSAQSVQSSQTATFASQQVASQHISRTQMSKQESFSSQVMSRGGEAVVELPARTAQLMPTAHPILQQSGVTQSFVSSQVVQQKVVQEVISGPAQPLQREETVVRQQMIDEQTRVAKERNEQQKVTHQQMIDEQSRVANERMEEHRSAQQQLRRQQQEQMRLDQERQEQIRQEQIRQENIRQEQMRQEKMRADLVRQERIRQEQERQQHIRMEQQRQEEVRLQKLRQEAQRRELARQEKEQQEEVQRQEQLRLQQERQQQWQQEQQRRQDEYVKAQQLNSQEMHQSHVLQRHETQVQQTFLDQQSYTDRDGKQPPVTQQMQKVTSQTMVRKSLGTRLISQEEKENQEQIYLKHLVPNQYEQQDIRDRETVKLRHIVPSRQTQSTEAPQPKQTAPRFTHVCQDVTILEGQVARFDCRYEPISDPYLRIEWFHNSKPLIQGSRSMAFAGSGHVFLNFTSCVKEDSGTYVCTATNRVGTDRVQINLTVIDKSELALNELDEEERIAMEKFQVLEDANRFQSQTQIEEERRQLPRFLTPFKNQRLNEGEVAHFECKIEPSDDPTLRVLWFHDSQELLVGSRWQHFHDFGFVSLNILHCVEQDSGTYVCRIVNSEGFAELSVTLEVIGSSTLRTETMHPDSMKQIGFLEDERRYQSRNGDEDSGSGEMPKFISKFRDQRTNEREAAHFEARFEPVDDSSLKIEWFHDGKELTIGSRWQHFTDFGFVCLNILKCQTEDSGEYVCRLTNSSGSAEQSVRLEVITLTEAEDREAMEKFRYLEDGSRFKREAETDEEMKWLRAS